MAYLVFFDILTKIVYFHDNFSTFDWHHVLNLKKLQVALHFKCSPRQDISMTKVEVHAVC